MRWGIKELFGIKSASARNSEIAAALDSIQRASREDRGELIRRYHSLLSDENALGYVTATMQIALRSGDEALAEQLDAQLPTEGVLNLLKSRNAVNELFLAKTQRERLAILQTRHADLSADGAFLHAYHQVEQQSDPFRKQDWHLILRLLIDAKELGIDSAMHADVARRFVNSWTFASSWQDRLALLTPERTEDLQRGEVKKRIASLRESMSNPDTGRDLSDLERFVDDLAAGGLPLAAARYKTSIVSLALRRYIHSDHTSTEFQTIWASYKEALTDPASIGVIRHWIEIASQYQLGIASYYRELEKTWSEWDNGTETAPSVKIIPISPSVLMTFGTILDAPSGRIGQFVNEDQIRVAQEHSTALESMIVETLAEDPDLGNNLLHLAEFLKACQARGLEGASSIELQRLLDAEDEIRDQRIKSATEQN